MKKHPILFVILVLSSFTVTAQCYPDRHNTTWYDGWISCEASENPNSNNGVSHWIMYDLGKEIKIDGIHVWNSNIPDHLDYGIKEAKIEYSDDGTLWQTLDTFTFEKAPGLNTYEGFDLPDPGSFRARYILITALSNYDGSCYGLSEVRFSVDSTYLSVQENLQNQTQFNLKIYPNPFSKETTVEINTKSNKRLTWFVTDTRGKRMISKTTVEDPVSRSFTVNGSGWPTGVYFLTVKQAGQKQVFRLIKMNR